MKPTTGIWEDQWQWPSLESITRDNPFRAALYRREAQMANANVGEWVEEVQVERNVSETVKLYPGARLQVGREVWVLLSEQWSNRLRWATPEDGYLGGQLKSGGDACLPLADIVLSEGDATKRHFLNHTVTRSVTVTETKRTPVGAGSVFEHGSGSRRILTCLSENRGVKERVWTAVKPSNGQAYTERTLQQVLTRLKEDGYRLVEAKGV
jgi:hypothetical protein